MSLPALPRPASPHRAFIRPTIPKPAPPAGYQPPYPGTNGGNPGGVLAIQKRLGNTTADGVYGPVTAAHVAAYQRAHGLDDDGTVGPLTWRSMLG